MTGFIFTLVLITFLISAFRFLNMWLTHRQTARGQILFSRLPHETAGQSRWQVVDAYSWAKKSFPEKAPSVFSLANPLGILSMIAIATAISGLGFATAWGVVGVSMAVLSLVFVHKFNRLMHDIYIFGMANLCAMKTQTWVQDAVLAQGPEVEDGNIIVLQGEP